MDTRTELRDEVSSLRGLVDGGDFEEVKAGLERCVALLEQGGLTLSASVDYYELGLRLASRCETLLREAELRISVLEQNEDLGVAPF